MIKSFLFIIIASVLMFNFIGSKVEDNHWSEIIVYLATHGEANNKNEFEAAKQAFLNIQDDIISNNASRAISRKWSNVFPEAKLNVLKALVRYPNMTAADVKAAGEKLFKDHEGFINGAGEGQLNMNCRIP